MSRLLEHLGRQVASSRRLLEIVIVQRDAIRRQDVETVLASLADVHAEMGFRARLEQERDSLLAEAAVRRGAAPETLDLEDLLAGCPAGECLQARTMSAELRGLIVEVGRIHEQNRVLIRQELTFLDHLMRVLSGAPQAGYSANGWLSTTHQAPTVVDARA
ncbi:MAG TPA: flagellar protein FlgN [Gaiellales bacterium]|nr:flagellar protein FlgN [Gaiellales bacterium]